MGCRDEVWLLRRGYVLLGAAAFLIGAFAPLTVSADEYDQLGTVADGVFLVESSEERFRITAEDTAGVLVYEPTGELILARELVGGDEHDVALDGERALVALFGGPASIEATGEGDVTEVETETKRLELVEAGGDRVDRTVTIELPPMLVGITGGIDGDAKGLVVEGSTDEGRVFRVEGDELAHVDREIAPSALDARALDVHVNATRLNGTVWLELVTPTLATAAPRPVEPPVEEEATNPEPAIHDIAHTPIRFTVEEEATLTFDVEGGYLLDASVYGEDGSQVLHVHEGPDVAKARNDCRDILDCDPHHHEAHDQLAPTERSATLEEGTYVLYVREGAVRGNVTLEDADGQTLFDEATELELTWIDVVSDRSIGFSTPVLDVYVDAWGSSGIDQELAVLVEEETAYSYSALASGLGGEIDSERSMQPAVLRSGDVTVEIDGLNGPEPDRLSVELLTVAD